MDNSLFITLAYSLTGLLLALLCLTTWLRARAVARAIDPRREP
jgi:hypothetical protein